MAGLYTGAAEVALSSISSRLLWKQRHLSQRRHWKAQLRRTCVKRSGVVEVGLDARSIWSQLIDASITPSRCLFVPRNICSLQTMFNSWIQSLAPLASSGNWGSAVTCFQTSGESSFWFYLLSWSSLATSPIPISCLSLFFEHRTLQKLS